MVIEKNYVTYPRSCYHKMRCSERYGWTETVSKGIRGRTFGVRRLHSMCGTFNMLSLVVTGDTEKNKGRYFH